MNDATARLTVRQLTVIAPSNVGDMVLVLPVIAQLARRFPKAQLTIAGSPRTRLVVDGDPRASHFIEYGTDGQTWRDRLGVVGRLRQTHYDLIVDLRHTLLPWLLRGWRRTNPLRQPPETLQHRHDRYQWQLDALLRPLKLPTLTPPTPQELWAWTPQEYATVRMRWTAWRLGARPVVLVSPAARSDDKRWPVERFAAVCGRLVREQGADVVLAGEAHEAPILTAVQQAMAVPVVMAAGELSVRTLALVMSRCDGLLTNDSAALHIASGLDVPTVAVFGPTDPAKYGPRSRRAAVMRAPSGQMADVSVDDVWAAARRVFAAARPATVAS